MSTTRRHHHLAIQLTVAAAVEPLRIGCGAHSSVPSKALTPQKRHLLREIFVEPKMRRIKKKQTAQKKLEDLKGGSTSGFKHFVWKKMKAECCRISFEHGIVWQTAKRTDLHLHDYLILFIYRGEFALALPVWFWNMADICRYGLT